MTDRKSLVAFQRSRFDLPSVRSEDANVKLPFKLLDEIARQCEIITKQKTRRWRNTRDRDLPWGIVCSFWNRRSLVGKLRFPSEHASLRLHDGSQSFATKRLQAFQWEAEVFVQRLFAA